MSKTYFSKLTDDELDEWIAKKKGNIPYLFRFKNTVQISGITEFICSSVERCYEGYCSEWSASGVLLSELPIAIRMQVVSNQTNLSRKIAEAWATWQESL